MYYDSQGRLHATWEEWNAPNFDPPDAPFIEDPQGVAPMPTIEERLTQLEKQVPLQTEGLRRVTEGKYNGAEGSAGIVVELEGHLDPGLKPQPDFK